MEKRNPKKGDVVSFFVRAHPTMGKPYEVIGRVDSDARGLYAGNRYLSSAVSEIIFWQQEQPK